MPEIRIRPLDPTDCITDLTALLHTAYAPLAAMGFNDTAADQTEDITRQRIARGTCLVATDGEILCGTVMLHAPGASKGCPFYERPDVATIGQFAVLPGHQNQGIGARLLHEAEHRARQTGATHLALDTSESATHLIAWYEHQGFRVCEHVRWHGKTYRSVIMYKLQL